MKYPARDRHVVDARDGHGHGCGVSAAVAIVGLMGLVPSSPMMLYPDDDARRVRGIDVEEAIEIGAFETVLRTFHLMNRGVGG